MLALMLVSRTRTETAFGCSARFRICEPVAVIKEEDANIGGAFSVEEDDGFTTGGARRDPERRVDDDIIETWLGFALLLLLLRMLLLLRWARRDGVDKVDAEERRREEFAIP